MGLGIGHGMNDEPAPHERLADKWPRERLADKWLRELALREKRTAADLAREIAAAEAWADATMERVRADAVRVMQLGLDEVPCGAFCVTDLVDPHRENYFPTRDQLRGGAQILYDALAEEGLRLYVWRSGNGLTVLVRV